mmetsp:Transcript_709/g.1256  ORF Transcript_709/g.1256 Transcript_709/m.1256 type:complete len:481 (+) Transcript_709:165-1607(+)|eukprot:CAMPEP_0198209954 /NCGR_PEP_ID=MMETSP1445-20131203/17829_1 /TAXON_ID=36898 /ORGANISM="Pyramimonas sp., Strain CCMP2087" /LENGTH=480 /DNA_ID=CAMNT_0043883871 /DNA_START=163 /DNA_END=1605 /DNA_ORIENTATION=+
MLKSVKQKLGGKKPVKNDAPEPSGVVGRSGANSTGVNRGVAPPRPTSKERGGHSGSSFSNFDSSSAQSAYAEGLPAFRDVPAAERQQLFSKKLQLCTFSYDFLEPSRNVREKEIKRQTLLELVDYVNTGQGKFTESVFDDIVHMLSANLFRALPPSSHDTDNYDPEEEEPTLEPAWAHLQIVYEFLLRYVVSNETDAKIAKKYIDNSFVLRLLELFDSEDPRERDYLKTILHRIYGKFMVHRPYIRKGINNIFYRFIYETERHNGIAELLEILGSIINGFALPLKEEHKVFLGRALMPLHKPKCVAMYHQQLSYCITQFVEKDPKLADLVLRGLLKFWPVTNSQKEVLFLGELEEILELTQAAEFTKTMPPMFRQIAKCINSSHFQVGERALFLWNNDYIVSLVAQNRHLVLPVVFGALERNARTHWNAAVHGLTCNVRKMFMEMDQGLFDECLRQFDEEESRAASVAEQRERQWKKLRA